MNESFTEDVHELTEKLAYENWERRGRPMGSPEVDWRAAEETLALSHTYKDLPLYSLQMEPSEGSHR
jgi:hypothetical protein